MEKKIKNQVLNNAMFIKVYHLATEEQREDLSTSKAYGYTVDGKDYIIFDGKKTKICVGPDYNFIFDKTNGNFKRFGKTYEEDPTYSPVGPEIWDCEASTICQGVSGNNGDNNVKSPCKFCYKSNTLNGENLSFEDFKKMVDLFPKTLTQIAIGSDSQATSNPDLWKMMEYCRKVGIVPNITVAEISDETADKLAKYCGATAISRYSNKNICYDSVKKLTDRGMTQINIHSMLSLNTFDACMETAKDFLTDERLKKMGAIVFLGLKKKGRAKTNFDTVPFDKFKQLISFCLENKIRFGFDSCSACRFEKVVKDMENLTKEQKDSLIMLSESCESGILSFYTNINSEYFPCSFTEGEKGWEKGLSMLEAKDFIKDIWYHPKNLDWRNRLISSTRNGCRQCLSFPEINSYKV